MNNNLFRAITAISLMAIVCLIYLIYYWIAACGCSAGSPEVTYIHDTAKAYPVDAPSSIWLFVTAIAACVLCNTGRGK